jgi:hypothetical protein
LGRANLKAPFRAPHVAFAGATVTNCKVPLAFDSDQHEGALADSSADPLLRDVGYVILWKNPPCGRELVPKVKQAARNKTVE